MTQAELGSRVFVSGAYIGQFEQAFRKPQLDISQRIDEVLQTDGIFERLCRKLIDDKRYADYFAQVVEFERTATRICEFTPTVVPGLLQTAAYAGAVGWSCMRACCASRSAARSPWPSNWTASRG
ncbi:transcriptional regulator with XRE-family HTH domain [Streptomyces sp. SAI-218]